MIFITEQDMRGIGQLAIHFDTDKFNIAQNHAKLHDLKPKLCDLYYVLEVEGGWESNDVIYQTIVNRQDYQNCNGNTVEHMGLKYVLAYFTYSRYLIINGFNDTPNGEVTKTNPFSIPKPIKDIELYANKYRDMALEAWEMVEAYICLHREDYPTFPTCNCSSCGCNGCCGKPTHHKGYGVKSRIITRRI